MAEEETPKVMGPQTPPFLWIPGITIILIVLTCLNPDIAGVTFIPMFVLGVLSVIVLPFFWLRWLQRPKPAVPPLPDTLQDETIWPPAPKV